MTGSILVIVTFIAFLVAYKTYGSLLSKKWGLSEKNLTPAKKINDDNDYIPTPKIVVLGHQFSSIAGAGPITGVISALAFGWLPSFLWIVLGSIFIGGVHDFSSLVVSIKHNGKSIGEIINANLDKTAKKIFNIFAWITLMIVLAAFTYFVSASFADTAVSGGNLYSGTGPSIATASILICFAAIIFGFNNHIKKPLLLNTLICIGLLVLSIFIGFKYPFIKFSLNTWFILISMYIVIAANLPQWIMLQPRGYLVSYLLYGIIFLSFVGVLFCNPSLENITMAKTYDASCGGNIFPFLFVTIACGAISGFHSLVSSGSSSKTLAKEIPDAQFVGYGAMLLEGLFAVVIIGIVAVAKANNSTASGFTLFYAGMGSIFEKFSLPYQIGYQLGGLAFSMFCLTTLDSATRIARYMFSELCDNGNENDNSFTLSNFFAGKKINGKRNVLGAICATLMTVVPGYFLCSAKYGEQAAYNVIWPIFGSANQLLGALALLAVSSYFLNTMKNKKVALYTLIPTIFMFAITLTAISLSFKSYLNNILNAPQDVNIGPNVLLAVIAVILFALAVIIIIKAFKKFVLNKKI